MNSVVDTADNNTQASSTIASPPLEDVQNIQCLQDDSCSSEIEPMEISDMVQLPYHFYTSTLSMHCIKKSRLLNVNVNTIFCRKRGRFLALLLSVYVHPSCIPAQNKRAHNTNTIRASDGAIDSNMNYMHRLEVPI